MQPSTKHSIQWAAQVTLPDGSADLEIGDDRGWAVTHVSSANRHCGADVARLVYRNVHTGPWRPDVNRPGSEWGIQVTWPHGHAEVEQRDTRVKAERAVSQYNGAGCPQLVTRTVTYGPWRPAAEVTG